MNREEALHLLQGGEEGVAKWNRRRAIGEMIPNLRESNLREADLQGVDFQGTDLRGAYLVNANLQRADFTNADLQGVDFQGTDLRGAYLVNANLQRANLINARLQGARLWEADLRGAYLYRVNLQKANLQRANLNRANLSGKKPQKVNLRDADLSYARLQGANLQGVDLTHADLQKADLRKADLRRAFLQRANLQGADLTNARLQKADLSDARLQEADLREADLRGACLITADLKRANITNADLQEADLQGANLQGVKLQGANIGRANLLRADLQEADLRRASFHSAILSYAHLIDCDLSESIIDGVQVENALIVKFKGLPKPPEWLLNGDRILKGEVARTFFTMPAIVEVFLSVQLNQIEIGCYHFHIGEVHASEVAIGVFLIGFRHEGDGSVLRFQAKDHAEIYNALPDLLAPFPGAQAIDWKKSIESITEKERNEAIIALVKLEAQTPQKRWGVADRIAAMFANYRNAKIYRIDEGRSKGIRLELFTNESIRKRLALAAREGLSEEKAGFLPPIQMGDQSKLIVGVERMGDEIKVEGDNLGNIGSGTQNAHDITQYKDSVNASNSLDTELKEAFIKACTELEALELSTEDKQDVEDDLGKLTVEMEKDQPNESRVRRCFNNIKEIAAPVADALSMAASIATLVSLR